LRDAVELGQRLGEPMVVGEGIEIPYAVVPKNADLVPLLHLKYPYGLPPRKPDHIKASVALGDAASFCRYVKLYQDETTRVFASPEQFGFRAILDYHPAIQKQVGDGSPEAADLAPAPASANFTDHSATLTLKRSDQWNLWMAKNEKAIPQAEFAEFVEDNYRDIASPPPAVMLEVARDLKATIDVNFASKVTSKNGAVQLAYQEVVTAGVGPAGNMEIPDTFSILIPVFYGEKPVQIEARLRFRIANGKLTFIYKLYRPLELLADAFQLAAVKIGETLGTDVLLGSL